MSVLRACVSLLIPISAANSQLRLTHLGTAGWEITDGKTVVFVDPYLSRVKIKTPVFDVSPDDPRPTVTDNDVLNSEGAIIDAHVKRADFILITHTHFDHVMDTPYIARKTGATVIGTESTTNFVRASGVPNRQLITVKGGEDMEFGSISVRVIPSLHGPRRPARNVSGLDDDVALPGPSSFPAEPKPPFRYADLKGSDGGTLAYLVRLASLQILVFGSMDYIEREVNGLRPDVAIIGALPIRLNVYHYTERLLQALGYPRLVLPTHWDRCNVPYDMSQQPALHDLQAFVGEVKSTSATTEVIVPAYFQTIEIPPSRGQQKRR